MLEIWKDIVGYEGLYQVSNMGRVKNLEREVIYGKGAKRIQPEHILKTHHLNNGYCGVELNVEGKGKQCLIHRLVAEAFIPNPNNYPQVNHINCICTDNRVENLEWCTANYNANYGDRNKKISKALTNNALVSKAVLQYTKEEEFITEYPSLKEAERQTGIPAPSIWCSCKRKTQTITNKGKRYLVTRHTAGGFIWKFKEGAA